MRDSKSWWRHAVTFLMSTALLVVLASIGYLWLVHYDQWSIAEVNEHLGVTIPVDALNINVSGHKGLNPSLVLEFDSPPESADQYAKQLCGGPLYQRYDPFNATDVDIPSRYAYPIMLYGKDYYSFSTLASDDDWGHRCEAPDGIGILQVVVEHGSASLSHVKAEYSFACYSGGCNVGKVEQKRVR